MSHQQFTYILVCHLNVFRKEQFHEKAHLKISDLGCQFVESVHDVATKRAAKHKLETNF